MEGCFTFCLSARPSWPGPKRQQTGPRQESAFESPRWRRRPRPPPLPRAGLIAPRGLRERDPAAWGLLLRVPPAEPQPPPPSPWKLRPPRAERAGREGTKGAGRGSAGKEGARRGGGRGSGSGAGGTRSRSRGRFVRGPRSGRRARGRGGGPGPVGPEPPWREQRGLGGRRCPGPWGGPERDKGGAAAVTAGMGVLASSSTRNNLLAPLLLTAASASQARR